MGKSWEWTKSLNASIFGFLLQQNRWFLFCFFVSYSFCFVEIANWSGVVAPKHRATTSNFHSPLRFYYLFNHIFGMEFKRANRTHLLRLYDLRRVNSVNYTLDFIENGLFLCFYTAYVSIYVYVYLIDLELCLKWEKNLEKCINARVYFRTFKSWL